MVEIRSTIKVLFILNFASGPESESESESESEPEPGSEPTRSPESESELESEQPHYDSAPLKQRQVLRSCRMKMAQCALMTCPKPTSLTDSSPLFSQRKTLLQSQVSVSECTPLEGIAVTEDIVKKVLDGTFLVTSWLESIQLTWT